jgi:peroxiredoxin
MPDLNTVYEKYRGSDFALISISINDSIETLREFVEEYGVTFPVLLNDKHIEELYEVTSIPTTFLIDRQGKIVHKHLGYVPQMVEILSREIEELL